MRIHADGFLQDVRYALRTFARAPGYVSVVVLTLALGIGANTAIFSVIHGVLVRPLQNRDGHRLAVLEHGFATGGLGSIGFSVHDLADYRANLQTVDALVEVHQMSFNLIGEGEPEEVLTGVVDHRYFEVMGVEPILGRGFTEEEDRLGSEAVMVLTYAYWQRRFGGDPGVLGRTFRMNDRTHTVIGVLPDVPQYPRTNDIYVPTSQCPIRSSDAFRSNRNARMMSAFARLRPGSTLDALSRDAARVSALLAREHVDAYGADRGYAARATLLREELVRDARLILLLLLGTAGLVLLVACANVANLALARLSRRERELTVRRALGADSGRLAQQLLTESTVLALAGAVLGVGLAWLGGDLLIGLASRFTPRAAEASLSLPVLGFALASAVLTGLLFGTAPALASRRAAATVVREGAGATLTRRRLRLQNALVAAQLALAFVLLTGAGLLLRSFLVLNDTHPGFDSENVVTMRVAFPVGGPYADAQAQDAFWDAVLPRIRERPGVVAAAVANLAPLAAGSGVASLRIDGGAAARAEPIQAQPRTVTPDYFRTVGVRLLAGQGFPEGIRREHERVAVINETFARTWFDGASPLDARLVPCNLQGTCNPANAARIIGVVADVRNTGLHVEPAAEVYLAGPQQAFWGNRILVRTSSDPLRAARDFVSIVHARDPHLPVEDIRTLASLRAESLAPRRLTLTLLGLFAGVALAVTLAGIVGVTSFAVGERRREIGIRLALGAHDADILHMVLRQGLAVTLLGLAVGLAGAIALSGLLASLVWGISTTDPLTYAAVAVLFVLAAGTACYVPARRATAVEPVEVLRT